jgi:hypothetical protein
MARRTATLSRDKRRENATLGMKLYENKFPSVFEIRLELTSDAS